MKKYFHKLQSKITICILTFVIIPVIAINLLLQLQLENQLLKNTDFAFQNAVTNVNNTLKTLMREMGVTLNLLSTTPSLYKALETEKKSLNDELKTKISIDNLTSQFQKFVFYCPVDFIILDRQNTTYSTYYISNPDVWNTPETAYHLKNINKKSYI